MDLNEPKVRVGVLDPAYQVRVAVSCYQCHALILRVHDSREAAEADRSESFQAMDLWIRLVGSLQDAVRAGDALAIARQGACEASLDLAAGPCRASATAPCGASPPHSLLRRRS